MRPDTPTARENHPDRLVLLAAVRLAEHYDLPGKGRLRRLSLNPDDFVAVNDAAHGFAARARDAVAAGAEIRHSDRPDVAVALARNVAAAGVVAQPLRVAAEGNGEPRCTIQTWTLLVMIMTVVYVRARERATTTEMITTVEDLAAEIAAL